MHTLHAIPNALSLPVSSYQAIRIKGEGMPKHGTPSEFGDLTITFTVEFPSKVDGDLAAGLENLLPSFSTADMKIGAP